MKESNLIAICLSFVRCVGFGTKVISVRVICESHPTSHWEIFSFRMEIVLNKRFNYNKITIKSKISQPFMISFLHLLK